MLYLYNAVMSRKLSYSFDYYIVSVISCVKIRIETEYSSLFPLEE